MTEFQVEDLAHKLVQISPQNKILSTNGHSANLRRTTRVISDRIIYFDNIPQQCSQDEFLGIVKKFAVKGAIVDVKYLVRTKGTAFAFVEFESEDDGRNVIATLNKKEMELPSGVKLSLRVSKAENPPEAVSSRNLYVSQLPNDLTSEELQARFDEFGQISHCRMLQSHNESAAPNTGVGFVHFVNQVDAAKAIEGVDGKRFDPENEDLPCLEVKFARTKKSKRTTGTNRNRRGWNGGRRGQGGKKGRRGGRGAPNQWGRGNGRGVPNWNRGRDEVGMANRQGGNWGMYPPNEEVWAKMVELMQHMSMWQNPYGVYGANCNYPGQDYRDYHDDRYGGSRSPN